MTLAEVKCPVCQGSADREVGVKHGLRILRCRDCTAHYSEFRPELQALPVIYGEHYFHGDPGGYPAYERDEPIHRERARTYLADLARHSAHRGSILDVGCATGFFLDEARKAGWDVQGCEVSEWAADYAKRKLNLPVSRGTFPTPDLASRQFDAVMLLNVLEQLPDPRAAEIALRSLVLPGGVVALETWNVGALVARLSGMRWHQYRPRDTPVYINRKALTALFMPVHWEVVEFRPRTKWIRLQHGLHALGLHVGYNGNGRPKPGTFGDRLARFNVPYRLGDLVWSVLRRKADGP